MAKLSVGEEAPDFVLPDKDGRQVSLRDFRGKSNVVIYFYPKDFTAGCTAETKTFGERYDEFKAAGAEVLGVSSDDAASHREFAAHCGAEFILLSDAEGKVGRAFGVNPTMGLIPGRVTFVVDRSGRVRHIYSSQLNPKKHVREALDALVQIEGERRVL
jgi:thioredoxin-dependent peroxiredoxin